MRHIPNGSLVESISNMLKTHNINQMWQLSQETLITVLHKQTPGTTSILIVEDDEAIVNQLLYFLNQSDYNVLGILNSGEKLIKELNHFNPDILIMDIELSGTLDGISTVEKLHDQYNLPIIYLSAKTDQKTLQRAQSTVPFGYLTKPINPIELRFTIELAIYKHKAEQELETQRKWLKTALTSIGEGVISIDKDGLITFINPCAEKGLTLPADIALNTNFNSILELLDVSKILVEPVKLAIENDFPIQFNNSFLRNKATDNQLPIDCTVAPLFNSEKQISGSIIIFRDITQRLNDDHDKNLLETQLRHSQKMEAIGQLAGGISHEFNNIITGMLTYTELAQANLSSEDPIYRYHNIILKKLDQASMLSRKLLTFSRKEKLNFQSIDLNEIVDNHLQFLEQTIRNGVTFKTELDRNIRQVNADANALEQIITNLCLNAKDAFDGKGIIELRTTPFSVTADLAKILTDVSPGNYVKLSVKDNGTGMDEKVRQRIFEPFFTTKSSTKGTGLGLSVVYGLIKQHHGWIDCKSQPLVGTLFDLYFPATQI